MRQLYTTILSGILVNPRNRFVPITYFIIIEIFMNTFKLFFRVLDNRHFYFYKELLQDFRITRILQSSVFKN